MKNTLEFLLEKNNVSKSQLARDLGVTRQTIIRACSGKSPSLELSLKLAKYFKLDVSEIFFAPSVNHVGQNQITE